MGGEVSTPIQRLGIRTANDDTPAALAATTIYQVTSDGFLTFNTIQGGNLLIVEVLTDADPTPDVVVVHQHGDWGEGSIYVCVPIKKYDYFQITLAGGALVENIKWIPFGTGVCQDQT